MYYGIIRIVSSIGFLGVILMISWATITLYLYLDYGNVIILCFWTIIAIIGSNEAIFILAMPTFFFSIPITHLNYLFDELIEKLRVAIRWNNEQRFHQVLLWFLQIVPEETIPVCR